MIRMLLLASIAGLVLAIGVPVSQGQAAPATGAVAGVAAGQDNGAVEVARRHRHRHHRHPRRV